MVLLDKDRVYDPNELVVQEKLRKVLSPVIDSDSLAHVVDRLMADGYTITPAGNKFESQVSGGRLIAAYGDAFVFEVVTSGHWSIGSGDGRKHVNGESFTYLISDRIGVGRDWKVKRVTLGDNRQEESLDCTVRVGYIPLPEPEKLKEPGK